MGFRCPRTRHLVNQEICEGRKAKKHHGCVTCTAPRQAARDQAIVDGLRVRVNLDPKSAQDRNKPIKIVGLGGPVIQISKAVARDLLTKLQAAVNGG